MEIPGLGPNLFRNHLKKGDNVMFDNRFDLLHPLDIDLDFLPDVGKSTLRNLPLLSKGFANQPFDTKPGLEFVFGSPDGLHTGQGIAVNHADPHAPDSRCWICRALFSSRTSRDSSRPS